MGVQVEDLSGFSCPELLGGAAEFEMIADVKPTRISVTRPPSANQSDGGFSVVVGREGNSADCVTIPYTIKSRGPHSIPGWDLGCISIIWKLVLIFRIWDLWCLKGLIFGIEIPFQYLGLHF